MFDTESGQVASETRSLHGQKGCVASKPGIGEVASGTCSLCGQKHRIASEQGTRDAAFYGPTHFMVRRRTSSLGHRWVCDLPWKIVSKFISLYVWYRDRHRKSGLRDLLTSPSERPYSHGARHRRSCLGNLLTSWSEGLYSLRARRCLRDPLSSLSEGGTCNLGHRWVCDYCTLENSTLR